MFNPELREIGFHPSSLYPACIPRSLEIALAHSLEIAHVYFPGPTRTYLLARL